MDFQNFSVILTAPSSNCNSISDPQRTSNDALPSATVSERRIPVTTFNALYKKYLQEGTQLELSVDRKTCV